MGITACHQPDDPDPPRAPAGGTTGQVRPWLTTTG